MQNARRDQAKNGFLTIDHQGVASIVATLKPHNPTDLLGQPVDDFAFALIAPLGANDDNVSALLAF
jgi:hypothetical protein